MLIPAKGALQLDAEYGVTQVAMQPCMIYYNICRSRFQRDKQFRIWIVRRATYFSKAEISVNMRSPAQ